LAQVVSAMMARPSVSSVDLQCLAMVVYHEARYQSVLSQLAVAEVVANRARSGQFPRSLCKVVNQPGQFFATSAYRVPRASEAWRKAVAIAKLAQAEGRSVVASGALFYHAAWMKPAWAQQHVKVAEIEGNIFYR
jgi:spore germination cell wall hydrolase CwlJ-like protein